MLPYQTKWMEDRSRLKIMEKARQVGMTTAMARNLATLQAGKSGYADVWVTSRDELQAKLFIDDCRIFLPDGHVLQTDAIKKKQDGTLCLTLNNGKRIWAISSNPNAQAGKRGPRILDEFALHADPQMLFGIAMPGVTWGGSVEIISTHRGSGNFFNKLLNEIKHKGNPKGFSHHKVTLFDAIRDGFLVRLQSLLPESDPRKWMSEDEYVSSIRATCPDEETWRQEYLCEPADDASAFLPWHLITAAETGEGEKWEYELRAGKGIYDKEGKPLHQQAALYLGVDVGRDNDLTVGWLVERVGDVLHTRRVDTFEKASFSEQEAWLYELMSCQQIRRCCIDATGLGRQFAERAAQKIGNSRVEAITLTQPMKETLVYPVRTILEDRKLRLPPDPVIRSDLRGIKRVWTSGSHCRFEADRGPNGHSDRFWALALALHAGKQAQTTGAHFERVERHGGLISF